MEAVTVTLALSPSVKEFIDSEVSSGHFASPRELITDLLDQAAKRRRVFERVEALLQEGVESGEPLEWTREAYEDLKRGILERHALRKGQNS